METLAPFIASLVGGLISGAAAMIIFSKWKISFSGNLLAGLVGGGFAGQYLGASGLGSISVVGGYLVSGLVGGMAVALIIGIMRRGYQSEQKT